MSLQDDFSNMISLLEDTLQDMGVSDAEFDASTGIMGLIDKVLNIPASIGGIDVITDISCSLSNNNIFYGNSITISGILEADKDDTTAANVDLEGYLKGATVKIYNGETLIGTAITDSEGAYSYDYTPSIDGNMSIHSVFEGTNNYDSCISPSINLSVKIKKCYFESLEEQTNTGGWSAIETELTNLPTNFTLTVDLYANNISGSNEQRIYFCPSSTWNGNGQPSLGVFVGIKTAKYLEAGIRYNSSTSSDIFLYNDTLGTYYSFKIIKNGNTWDYYIDDVFKYTSNVDMTAYNKFTLCWINWSNGTEFKFKNLKIEELKPLELIHEDYNRIDIPVSITWDDNNNADLNRPSSVTVTLYADGVPVDYHEVSSNDNWSYIFTQVPKYNEDEGTEIIYTVDISSIVLYYNSSVNGYTITNTYMPEVISASVLLAFNDNNNANGVRPQNVAVLLKRNTTETVNTVLLSEDNAWSASVNNLPTMYNGVSCTYAWQEPSIVGYMLDSTNTTENIGGGFTTTFTYVRWGKPPIEPGKPPKTPS